MKHPEYDTDDDVLADKVYFITYRTLLLDKSSKA